ncbi:tetratricopeptide repeat protein [Desulfovulcanus sp.]
MSAELTKARQKINSIASLLKQNKIFAAVNAMYEGVSTALRCQMMPAEKKELSNIIEKNLFLLNNNAKLREIYPILIEYKPGQEKKFLSVLKELLEMLEEDIADDAQKKLAELERQKQKSLAKAKKLLEQKKIDEAKQIFKQLIEEFDKDFQLKIDISDTLINAKEYKRAIQYLKMAHEDDPESVHIFNRLGMVLRKLGRFADAEKAYLQALKLDPNDEYLYFNMGRLYIDSQDWEKAAQMAQKALKLNPQFEQAKKMLSFIQKKLK